MVNEEYNFEDPLIALLFIFLSAFRRVDVTAECLFEIVRLAICTHKRN
jgi:hypothetical protein